MSIRRVAIPVLGLLSAVGVLAGCGRSANSVAAHDSRSDQAGSTQPTAPDALATWNTKVSGMPASMVTSKVALASTGPVALSVDSGKAVVWTFDQVDWTPTATIPVDESRPASPIQIADATGDGHDDFVITWTSNNHTAGRVITDDSGAWRAPQFEYPRANWTPNGLNDTAEHLTVSDARLISEENPCLPNCADAAPVMLTWRLAAEHFVVTNPDAVKDIPAVLAEPTPPPAPAPVPPPPVVPVPVVPEAPLQPTVSLHPLTNATCVAPDATDGGGNPVDYSPSNLLDGARATAWRCPGDASGNVVEFNILAAYGTTANISSVGLVPGYDKVDPYTGVDRFTEMRRVASATWTCVNASGYQTYGATQQYSPTRDMQVSSVSLIGCARLRLRIDSTLSPGGSLDFTPISDVTITGSLNQ
jgi:hypothetical protein